MKKLFLFGLLAALTSLSACQKEADEIICDPVVAPDPNNPIQAFINRHRAPSQFFTYDPTRTNSFTTAKGARLTVQPNTFVLPDGRPLPAGPVQLEFREIQDKGEMVLSGTPTVSNGSLLESGGEFFLKATQAGVKLRAKRAMNITLLMPAGLSSSSGMMMFSANLNGVMADSMQQGGFNWQPWQSGGLDSTFVIGTPVPLPGTPQVGSFRIQLGTGLFQRDSMNWFNCDRFVNVTQPRTTVTVMVAGDQPSPQNTRVFLVFNSLNGAMQCYQTSSPFRFVTYNVPTTMSVTAVVMRAYQGKFYFGKQTAVVAPGQTFAPTLTEMTEAAMVTELKRL
ncbi:hypothetical protein LJY25_02940 [Hymenobacter sp. BT175]|uniref:hypothetical protein n=1 Tax=Hymenobacter translucens TaxID=2886507 RepID=UPI001D0E3AD8|nr:hypothetical protein [Hymenobacter translucens]MCC2545387.1 hypothetical protein [Hymenobacter translucens]